jgi:hypothetical protein
LVAKPERREKEASAAGKEEWSPVLQTRQGLVIEGDNVQS